MRDATGMDLKGYWKTDKGIKVELTEFKEIPAQKVWVGLLETGQRVFFTERGEPLFVDVGDLLERRRGGEDVW